MKLIARLGPFFVALSVAVLPPNSAAAPKPISGKLSKPGYTLIALAENGEARTVVARDGSFALVPPTQAVTLQLRAPNGTYAGPVVLAERNKVKRARAEVRRAKRNLKQAKRKARGRLRQDTKQQLKRARKRVKEAKRLLRLALKQEAKRQKRAILGVRAGARLGRVKVKRGYAKLSKPVPKRWVDASGTARARRGVPIGAGNFGHVRSKPVPAPRPQGRPPGSLLAADPDLDGIPDRLDVDDDGDLILDYADSLTTARAADHQPGHPPPPKFSVTSSLAPPPSGVTNANPRHSADPSRPAFTDADIDAALRAYGALAFGLEGGGDPALSPLPSPARSELDCGGDPLADPPAPALKYCSNPGSTGRAFTSVAVAPENPGVPFPGELGGAFDPDRDGFGTFPASKGFGPHLYHGATSTEVKTGDLLFERDNDANGVETGDRFPTTVQYAFATVPVPASYRDTTMAAPAAVSYPFPLPFVPPLPVSAPVGQDMVVRLTFWRPQRRPIPPGPGRGGDPCLNDNPRCEWVDIGGLNYGAGLCHQGAFLPEDDPNLTDAPLPFPGSQGAVAGNGGYADTALDGAANPNNTLTFTVNITECLRRRGQVSQFDNAGEELQFGIQAVGRGGQVASFFTFRHQGSG